MILKIIIVAKRMQLVVVNPIIIVKRIQLVVVNPVIIHLKRIKRKQDGRRLITNGTIMIQME